jgi:hypothetical protein
VNDMQTDDEVKDGRLVRVVLPVLILPPKLPVETFQISNFGTNAADWTANGGRSRTLLANGRLRTRERRLHV